MSPENFIFWLKGYLDGRPTLNESCVNGILKQLENVKPADVEVVLNSPYINTPWPQGDFQWKPSDGGDFKTETICQASC